MKLFLLSIIIILSSCQTTINKTNEKERISSEIRNKVAIKIKNKYGLIPCGTGSQMMYQIKMLALAFDYHQPVDIEKGRELLIHTVDEFVSAVNADERIRPYLDNYPFEPKNIEMRIFLEYPDELKLSSDQLVVLSAIEGILQYKINDPNGPLFVIVHQEPYEEALQRMHAAAKKAI